MEAGDVLASTAMVGVAQKRSRDEQDDTNGDLPLSSPLHVTTSFHVGEEDDDKKNKTVKKDNTATYNKWDGVLVLTTIVKVYGLIKELWSVCKALDKVVPRTVCINFCTPSEVMKRLLQQHQRQVNHQQQYFPYEKMVLGIEWMDVDVKYQVIAAHDVIASQALMMLPVNIKVLHFGSAYHGPQPTCEFAPPTADNHAEKSVDGQDKANDTASSSTTTTTSTTPTPTLLPVLDFGQKKSLIEVNFGSWFNPERIFVFNNALKKLTFKGIVPDCMILPDQLEELNTNNIDTCSLSLPSSLQILNLDADDVFNQQLQLPAGLKKVSFGRSFNQPLQIPSRLEVLKFVGRSLFNQPLALPSTGSLRELYLGDSYDQPLQLPDGLEILWFGENDGNEFHFCNGKFSQPLTLPFSLKHLVLSEVFNHPVLLPPDLQSVQFGNSFNQSIVLPVHLEDVIFGGSFNQALILPKALRVIEFGYAFNHPVVFHNTLVRVKLGPDFKQPVDFSAEWTTRYSHHGWRTFQKSSQQVVDD